MPVWVILLNLPTKIWGAKSLSRIGSLLGVPLAADACTATQNRVSYACILVEVDVAKPLPKALLVEDEQGKVYSLNGCLIFAKNVRN